VRIFTRHSVDEKLYSMQQDKQELINKVFDPTGAKDKKQSPASLLRLFGPVSENESGQYIIGIDRPERSAIFDDFDEVPRFG
jgi:hypothetical protein